MFWMLSNILFLFLKLSGNANFPPPLSKEQERDYFEKCKNGDADARNILIERNLRLVAHIAKKYYSSGYDNDDLISIGGNHWTYKGNRFFQSRKRYPLCYICRKMSAKRDTYVFSLTKEAGS